MPRKNTFTVSAQSVQGNAGATVTFSMLTVGEWQDYGTVPGVNDNTLIRDHIVSWTGIVDDQGQPLPSPADDPDAIRKLYMPEQRALARLLFQGPDGPDAEKN